jgi:multidrug resistance efflux pump
MKFDNKNIFGFYEFLIVNKKLVIAVVVAVIGVLNIQYFTFTNTATCLGIVDSKEISISFESPVVVRRVFVLAGETVRKGQPLIEVDPIEVNLKLTELETQLQSLESEEQLRNNLLKTFRRPFEKGMASTIINKTPITQEIEGLRSQVNQLKKVQAQAIRYADEDGIIASVAFRANEQVAPFQALMTLTPLVPNLVYGFIHENHISEFQVGNEVSVESVTRKPHKVAKGKVASLGSRIVSFPERLQSVSGSKFWGRELIVSLPYQSRLLTGEKVQIRSQKSNNESSRSGLIAYAKSTLFNSKNENVAKLITLGLPFESSGLTLVPLLQGLLTAADEDGPKHSPFWLHSLRNIAEAKNLEIKNLDGIEDVESLSSAEGHYYAMSSMGLNKNDKVKAKRGLMIRFSVTENEVQVDRRFELRDALIDLIKKTPVLHELHSKIEEDIDIESLSIFEGDAYFALKSPQMSDGSSIVLKIKNFAQNIENQNFDIKLAEIYSLLKLEDTRCEGSSRISDMIKTKTGLLILSNCPRPDSISQIWWIANNAPAVAVTLIASLEIAKLEGMVLLENSNKLILSSDRGRKNGSDYYQLQIPVGLYESEIEKK